MQQDEKTKRKRKLRDLRAFEVSLVDKPANKREFLIIKRIQEENMEGKINLDTETKSKEELEIKTEFDLVAKMNELLEKVEAPLEDATEEEKTKKADEARTILGKIKALIDSFFAGKKPGYYYAYPYPYTPAKKDDLEALSKAVNEMRAELEKRTKELESLATKFNEEQTKVSKSLEEIKPIDVKPLEEKIVKLENETIEIKKMLQEIPIRKGFGFTPPGEKKEVDEAVQAILDDRSLHPAEKFKRVITTRFKTNE